MLRSDLPPSVLGPLWRATSRPRAILTSGLRDLAERVSAARSLAAPSDALHNGARLLAALALTGADARRLLRAAQNLVQIDYRQLVRRADTRVIEAALDAL